MVLPDDESGESSEGILEGVRSPRDFVGLGTLTRPTAIDDPRAFFFFFFFFFCFFRLASRLSSRLTGVSERYVFLRIQQTPRVLN